MCGAADNVLVVLAPSSGAVGDGADGDEGEAEGMDTAAAAAAASEAEDQDDRPTLLNLELTLCTSRGSALPRHPAAPHCISR